MTKIAVVVGAMCLLSATHAQAQTHPCDVPQATSFKVTTADFPRVFFCHIQTVPVDGAIVKLDNVDFGPFAAAPTTGVPNAAGAIEYVVLMDRTVSKGNHQVLVRAYNTNNTTTPPVRQESASAGPFDLSVVDPAPPFPSKPANVRIIK